MLWAYNTVSSGQKRTKKEQRKKINKILEIAYFWGKQENE